MIFRCCSAWKAATPWSLAARAYAPIVGLIPRKLARVAERDT
jgi:hypothetical protein